MKILLIGFLLLLSQNLYGQWTPLCGLPTYSTQSSNQFVTFIDAACININQCVSSDRYFVSPSSGYSSFLRYTNDGCASWTNNPGLSTSFYLGPTGASLIDVVPFQNTFYASVANHGFHKSTDGGATWDYINYGFYKKMFAFDTSSFYLMTNSSAVFALSKYQNGIISPVSNTLGLNIKDFHFTDMLTGYAVGDSGIYDVIIKTLDGGNSWSTIYSDSLLSVNDICFSSANIGYVVGNNGLILKTTDSGATWTNLSSGSSLNLNTVWFINDSTGFAGGDSGRILSTLDYGNSWISTVIASSYKNFTKIYFIGDTLGFALSKSIYSQNTHGSFYSINLNGTTDINEVNEINAVSIIPNPNSGTFSIRSNDAFQVSKTISIEIFDLNGKLLHKQIIDKISDTMNVQSNHLEPGVYLLSLSDGKKYFHTKLLIQ